MMRYLLLGLAYAFGMALILVAGFFPVMYLAGPHSGSLSGVVAGLVWLAYLAAVILGPWPFVRLLSNRFERGEEKK